jgi:hypothetical protein
VWKIGAIEITPVIELEIAGGTRFILPQASREEVLKIAWLQPLTQKAGSKWPCNPFW